MDLKKYFFNANFHKIFVILKSMYNDLVNNDYKIKTSDEENKLMF